MKKIPILLLGNSIFLTNDLKNLCVTFDSENTYASHITKVCHSCYYHIKDLRCIWKSLSVETATLLANSMSSSRMDYCNYLSYCISKYNVAKLQMIQNALCKIVFGLNRTSHVTPYLQNYTGSPFHTASCLNLISLHSRPLHVFSQPTYL